MSGGDTRLVLNWAICTSLSVKLLLSTLDDYYRTALIAANIVVTVMATRSS